MNRFANGLVVAVVVGAVLLAGCTAQGGPAPSPASSAPVESPEPSASATPSLTAEEQLLAQIPDAAKGDDLLAAVEMAEFYLLLQPELYRGGDSALWEFLALPECEFCSSTVTSTQQRVADGHLQVGGEYAVPDQVEDSVLDLETDDTTTALVGFEFTEEPYQIVAEDGTIIKSGDSGSYRAAFALRYVDGLWRVYEASV